MRKLVVIITGLTVVIVAIYFFAQSRKTLDSNFPDIVVMPEVKLVSNSADDLVTGPFHATWQADKSIDEIAAWYNRELVNAGWQPTVRMETGNASTIRNGVFERNGQFLNFSLIQTADGQVKISATLADKRRSLEEEGEEDALK